MDALRVVGEPTRREILRLVWEDVTFGAVSQHLGVLRQAGFVTIRVAGNKRFYRADRAAIGPLALALEAMWSASLDRLAAAVEADPEPPRPARPTRRP
jgi:DNA-binding transcriptional ArsR family regulator